MCGIVGRAGFLALSDERVFKVMLLLDYFRGQDSTGVCSVSKKGVSDVLKMADDPIMLFNNSSFDSTVVGVSDAIWIGHNRAATIGATSRSNAHPFEAKHITGVHNGTLDKINFKELSSRLENSYETDSETIFNHIATYGVDDTIPRLEGAWALVWFDSREKTLNMIRNDKRPLFTCNIKKGSSNLLTWASEYSMIVAARAMADVDDGELELDEEGYGYFPLPINTLHTWTLEQLLTGDLEPAKRMLHGKITSVVKHSHALVNNTNTKSFELIEDTYEVQDIDLDDNGKILGIFDEEEWNDISRFGCACCGATVEPDEEGILVFVNEGAVVCSNCSEETTTVISNAFDLNQVTNRIIG